jgi:two-component system OmpR family sensor kinase
MLGRIEAALAARAASEQRLRQFLADASHELRTPLTSIRGFAELYRRGGAPPGPTLDATMARIEDEAARMGLLVEDLLLLAALDEERTLDRRAVDLLAVAADTVSDAHARCPDRSVQLGVYRDAEAPEEPFERVTVLGDEPRLRQVATNLITNALHHTPADARIQVRVGRLPSPVTGGETVLAAVGQPPPPGTAVAVLEVADNGPGVPPGHASRIFERFYRAEGGRLRRNGGGSGLGLSIAAAITTAHGGLIELRSGSGDGSGTGATFRVLLPAARHDEPGPEAMRRL